jgi:hypothetical protein
MFSDLFERGIWIALNIRSSQLLQFWGAEYRTPVPSQQRSGLPLSTLANPSSNGFNVITKNIGQLPSAGSSGLISLYDNNSDFRCCYFHGRKSSKFIQLVKVKML